jgi:tartrate dehydratase beta subunit/fumarate hydratase class I family protein
MLPGNLLSSEAKPKRFVGLAISQCVLLQASRALQRMSIDPTILQKLTNRRLFTARDLLIATHLELVEALDIPFQAAEELLLYVCNQIAPASSTVRTPRPTTLSFKSDSIIKHILRECCLHMSQTCVLMAAVGTQVLDLYARAKLQVTHLPTQLSTLDQQLRYL